MYYVRGDVDTQVGVDPSVISKRVTGGTVKRAFDISFATLAIVSFLPLFLLIALAIRATGPGPVLYRHRRIGIDGRTFGCFKFRTMVVDADARLTEILANDSKAAAEFAATRKLRDDPRIIPYVGKFLRTHSFDELPQFFNVLIGDMSVVGPRPVTEEELLEHECYAAILHRTLPGITGAWQTSGRNDVSLADRMQLELSYARDWTFARDLTLVFRTVSVVFTGRGAY